MTEEERKERNRRAAREYARRHKKECYERHKAWADAHKEYLAEYARKRRHADPERTKAVRMEYYWRDHAKTLRKKKKFRDEHREQTLAQQRRGEENRKRKKMTDADYYAKFRSRVRKKKAERTIANGHSYHPHFAVRKPDWMPMGVSPIDVQSPFLAENNGPEQIAFSKEHSTQLFGSGERHRG